MTTFRRCPSCANWYEKALGPCPDCEEPAARHNKWLARASLNNQLFQQAEAATPKKEYERTYKHYRKKIKDTVEKGEWGG